jgi:hypothetical protein
MTKPLVHEYNCATQEEITREMTDDEIAQMEADQVAWKAQRAEQEAAEQAKATAKASALAKLAALGLTAEEAAAIAGS